MKNGTRLKKTQNRNYWLPNKIKNKTGDKKQVQKIGKEK